MYIRETVTDLIRCHIYKVYAYIRFLIDVVISVIPTDESHHLSKQQSKPDSDSSNSLGVVRNMYLSELGAHYWLFTTHISPLMSSLTNV